MLLPVLVRSRYPEKSSLGLVTVSGSIGLLLPPSLPVILYAVTAQQPIDQLFIGGILPGFLLILMVAGWGAARGWFAGAKQTPFNGREAVAGSKVARAGLTRLYTALRGLAAEQELDSRNVCGDGFYRAMDDDFNTPEAIAVLFEIAKEINRNRDADLRRAAELAGCLRGLGAVLGLLQDDPETFLRAATGAGAELSESEIEALIADRIRARERRNWAEADRIRKVLDALGIGLEDGASGTRWRRK